ncbi:hypothetical protein C8J57DRAFT_1048303 [Mycena rebaudengoi]|nr:hypothetical protein C8J57DRAFT_1048303 [Mycena rebaudengoi]
MGTFCTDELQRALEEESSVSSIGPFHLTTSSALCATASVTLLEGRTIFVTLTINGYSMGNNGPGIFENIEQLLCAESSLYQQRKQEALLAALEKLKD